VLSQATKYFGSLLDFVQGHKLAWRERGQAIITGAGIGAADINLLVGGSRRYGVVTIRFSAMLVASRTHFNIGGFAILLYG
jgi:hypothetical protein